MKTTDVVIVRIYITEASHLLSKIIDHLKSEAILGMSVFRAISGFGDSVYATASFIDLSLSLPLIIEFFDRDKAKIEKVVKFFNKFVKPGHIIFWEAKTIH